MNKRSFSWGVVIAILFFVSGIVVDLSSSLWFLRALLGEATGKYTIGYNNTFLHSNDIFQDVRNKRELLVPNIADRYNRFVYKREEHAEYIAGIPKFIDQFSLLKSLREDDWSVRRIGWIVIASRTSAVQVPRGENVSPLRAMIETLSVLCIKRLPAHPQLIAQTENTSAGVAAMYLEEKRRGMHMVIHTGSSRFVRGTATRFGKKVDIEETSYVALQRDFLSYLPREVIASLEDTITQSMNFTKTHPPILNTFLSFGPVVLATDGKSTALGVLTSETQMARLIGEWVNAEQGNRHPIKKAFLLPDKTVGYEYIPGETNAYFDLNKGKNSCFPSEGFDERLFLCGRDKAVALSNNENLGGALLSRLHDTHSIENGVIQGNVLGSIGLTRSFEKIEYSTSDEVIEIWADVKK